MFGLKYRSFANSGLLCVAALTALSSCVPAGAPIYDASRQQDTYATPQQAVEALVAANRSGDKPELLKILGPNGEKLITSGDPVADKEGREQFVAAYDAAHTLKYVNDEKEALIVGDKEWPLPILLVRQHDRWLFDTEAGEQEILNRRIGRNELYAIQVSRVYVDAQYTYAEQHNAANGKREYARHFLSHAGMHDGLYWPVAAGEEESPLGPLIASSQAEGYDGKRHNRPKPYHGYYYRILTRQSAAAPGGAINYLSGRHMTKGFALIAFPAKYGDSGIMTFTVNQDGIVYEKNLGPDTAKIAIRIKSYNPDDSWRPAQ